MALDSLVHSPPMGLIVGYIVLFKVSSVTTTLPRIQLQMAGRGFKIFKFSNFLSLRGIQFIKFTQTYQIKIHLCTSTRMRVCAYI